MARLSKAERYRRYKGRLEHAKKWRRSEGYDDLWRRLIDLYRGKHFPATLTSEDRIAVNIAFSTINVIYPSISVNHPKITVLANDPNEDDQAAILEAALNYWWRHHDVHRPFRRAVKDYLVLGHGWLKVGYRYKEGEEPIGDDEYQAEYDTLRSQADEFAEANPELAGDLPTDEEIASNIVTTKTVALEDRPFVERISPFDIYVDPEATCLEDAKWICQRFVRPLADVHADKRYREGVRRKVNADAAVRDHDEHHEQQRKKHDDTERVTLYEFYDLTSGTVSVCAEGSDDFLVEPQKVPYAFGHPFVMVRNHEVPDQFYPMGDLEALEGLQQELNKTRSQMVNHRKRYARKYLFYETALSPEGRQALESDEDGTFVPIVDENRPLGDQIIPLAQVPVAPEFYNHSAVIEDDIDKISGVSEYARGAVPEIRRTATEAAIIQDASNARAADKLAVVERVISDVARKLAQVAQQFLTGDQVARVVGANGAVAWVQFNRDDIMGEFDFSVEGGSTQPQNDTFRRQQAVAMMQALAPFIGTVIRPEVLARHVLQAGFNIKNADEFLMDPQEAAMMAAGMGGMPGSPDAPGGEPGLQPPPGASGESPDPQARGADSAIGGIPPELINQLMGQVALTPGIGAP